MQTLKGRTCVFAGATAGDGIAAVKALCAGGMNVVMATHMAARAQALVDEIASMGLLGKCAAIGVSPDGPAEESAATYEDLARQYGSVDVIISNTGTTGRAVPMEEVTTEELLHATGHLLGGAFGMLRAALPVLKRSRAPRVIFMTTVEGVGGGVHESFENAVAKGAVHSLTLNAAARLAGQGITVNCIAKGAIPRVDGIHPGDVNPQELLPRIPMGRLGTPEDLAQIICFLASEEGASVTGQTIGVSGGLELRT